MRRLIFILLLVFGVTTFAAPVLAAPDFAVGPPGSYYLFVEFGKDIRDYSTTDLILGSGFALDKDLTLGAQVQPFGDRFTLGVFANYWRQPLAVNADLRLAFPGLAGRFEALYLLVEPRFKAGIGLGIMANSGMPQVFVSLTGFIPLRESLGLYLTVETFPNTDLNLYHFGLTRTL